MDKSELKLLAIAVLLAAIIAGAWYFRNVEDSPRAVAPTVPAPEAPDEPAEPLHPLAPPEMSDTGPRALVPLPPLDDSDSYFLLALVDLLGPDVEPVLVQESLIDRFVASIDNLPRSHIAEKIRPAGGVPGTLVVDVADADGQYFLSSENYRRYDLLVSLVSRADIDESVSMYRRFYPLFQEAYQRLGYPDAYFNDRVVEVIDHLLAAPQPEQPIRLVRPHVLYEFADAELQSLSSGRKLLIRMGPDNAAVILDALRLFRAGIASS